MYTVRKLGVQHCVDETDNYNNIRFCKTLKHWIAMDGYPLLDIIKEKLEVHESDEHG